MTPEYWPAIPGPVDAGPRPERRGPPDGAVGETLLQEVLSEIRIWRDNRSLYPGWIVAPGEVRQHVWLYSEFWIPRILEALGETSVEQRFSILDELNWRLELCLSPLSPELAAVIETTLTSVDPVERSLIQTSGDRERPSLDWALIRRAWVALAVARLRYAREQDALDDLNNWAQRLQAFAAESPWLASRISYERCLLGLSRLDHELVERALARWNSSEVEPFWEVRKASVLAEIGKTAEAYTMSLGALEKIRGQSRRDRADISSLSRQGWAMVLCSGFGFFRYRMEREQEGNLPGGSDSFEEMYERWERLTTYRCNAWAELQELRSELSREVPSLRPRVEERPEFDQGSRTILSRHDTEDIRKLLIPAIQAKRLVEEAGVPPAVGGVSLARELLLKSAFWLKDEMPETA